MTKSEQIIIEAGQALRDTVLSISDNAEFEAFRREMFDTHGITKASLARISGVEFKHVMGKQRGADAYEGKPLTLEEHGDPDRPENFDVWWLENCPADYRLYLLERHINAARDHPIDTAYRREFGREPDSAGFAFYAGLFDAGDFSVNDMLRDMAKNGDQS